MPAKNVNQMVGLGGLFDIMQTALHTTYLNRGNPVSILLIAPSGGGKSAAIISMCDEETRLRVDRLTSSGLQSMMKDDDKEKKIKWLMIPDLNPSLVGKKSTTDLTMASLMTIISDGIVRISDGRVEKVVKHGAVGVIAGITPEIYRKHRTIWREIGFTRRFILIYFDYTPETLKRLSSAVFYGSAYGGQQFTTSFKVPPVKKTQGVFIPKKFIGQIVKLSEQLAALASKRISSVYVDKKKVGERFVTEEVNPIPYQITLMQIAKGNALRHKRGTVIEGDIKFVEKMLEWCDWENPKLV